MPLTLHEPGTAMAGSVADGLAILVAPSTGRFVPVDDVVNGGAVAAHEPVAVVTGGRGRSDTVAAPVAVEVAGLLAVPGQEVASGQPLAWVRRCAVDAPPDRAQAPAAWAVAAAHG